MTKRVKRTIGRWAAGALCALLMPLAFAHPPHLNFGGGGRGLNAPPGGGREIWRRPAPAAPIANRERNPVRIGASGYGPRWGLRPTPSYGHFAEQNPYRPISAEVRQVPHPPDNANMPMRAGSIRADVARYNEERGGRPLPPPRSQEEPARSPVFSPFYRN
jgi:hypothetical protein